MLLVSGTQDEVIPSADIDRLATQARTSGDIAVEVAHVDADHTFDRKHEELGHVVVDWIERRIEAVAAAETEADS